MGPPSKGILEKIGIVRNSLRKDLLLFFLPFLTFFFLGLILCQSHGEGWTGIWGTIWGLIKQPQNLTELPSHRIIGLVLFICGLSIMIISQVTLWENYSGFVVIKKNHKLITNGIYRFTRNPIYLGAFLVFAGLPVYAASLYGFIVMLILIPIFLLRIRFEEHLLAEEFKDAYQKYKETTKKLIPFIY